jgi:hypothetical protein
MAPALTTPAARGAVRRASPRAARTRRKPALCRGTWSYGGRSGPCPNSCRSVEEVAAEVLSFAPHWRAAVYNGCAPPDASEMRGREDSMVAYCADLDLPALALELIERLCRTCAEDRAEQFLALRARVYLALLAGFRSTGRDERAEEEFQLRAVAG